jgi:hypothetical protein
MVTGLATEFADTVVIQVATAVAIFASLLIGIGWPILGPLGRAAEDADVMSSQPGSASRAPDTGAARAAG